MGLVIDLTDQTQDKLNPIRRRVSIPAQRNLTEQFSINGELTRGLYHNSYPGLKLSGALAFAPIFIPVAFMGIPSPKVEDEAAQDVIDEYIQKFETKLTQIKTQCLREGTVHVWPYYDSDAKEVCLEFIRDESVTIVRDAITNKVTAYIVDEETETLQNQFQYSHLRKRRTFTEQTITTELSGSGVKGYLQTTVQRNVLGRLPHTFANDAEGQEMRGHSVYERILPDLKSYNDVERAWLIMLSEFSPKLAQRVQNVGKWLVNNGYATSDAESEIGSALEEIDIVHADMFLNQTSQPDGSGEEKTEIIFPTAAHEAYAARQQNTFYKIVEGTLLPEMVWGLVSTGNHASAEQQMNSLATFVSGKRSQMTPSFHALYESILFLANSARLLRLSTIDIEETVWGDIETLPAEVKARVLYMFAQALSLLMGSVTFTQEQLHNMWLEAFPRQTEADFNEFIKQLDQMAKFKKYSASQYDTDLDLPAPSDDPNAQEDDAQDADDEGADPTQLESE